MLAITYMLLYMKHQGDEVIHQLCVAPFLSERSCALRDLPPVIKYAYST